MTGTVYPHVALRTSTTSIPVYKNRRLICLNDMVAVKKRMQMVIKNLKVFFT